MSSSQSLLSIYSDFKSAQDSGDKERVISVLKELNKITFPEKFNWFSDIFEKLYEGSRKDAIIWYDMDKREEQRIKYDEVVRETNKLVNFLRSHGVNKGDPVYLATPVIPQHWFAFLSGYKGGFIIVPSAINLTTYEFKYRFGDLKPKAIIADYETASRIDEALGGLKPNVKLLVDGKREGWISYDEVDKESDKAEPAETSPKDEVLYYFTSGTTGMPKRVRHTMVSYPFGHFSTASIIGVKSSYVHLNLSAPGWAKFAWSSIFSPFIVGATVLGINYKRLDYERYLNLVAEYEVNSFCAPPTAWRGFIILDLKKFKFPKLEQVVSAGEPLNPEVIKAWKEAFGLTIRDFYGQTETTAMVGNMPWDDVTPGSMGRPSPLYDIVLLDDNFNEITKPYEIGHIAVRLSKWRAIGLFQGYSDENKNKEAFIGNYYLTGDKAYFDENGKFYFVSRADDVIKTSDYRVGPFEVESALLEHPAVAEAAVVGSPDPRRWQVVKAFIVLKPGYKPSEDLARDIREHVKKLLPSFKVPRIIEFVPELPKTISGKIRRNVLRQQEEERRKKGEKGEYEYFFT
ncbi:MAG: acyl--CoA ligase [Sulfolobaceae archaeon]|nr:acyl--CoA ligase [Sulfolobaceae archaeon]